MKIEDIKMDSRWIDNFGNRWKIVMVQNLLGDLEDVDKRVKIQNADDNSNGGVQLELPLQKFMSDFHPLQAVEEGQAWIHAESDNEYVVYALTNMDSEKPRFQPTVVYYRPDRQTHLYSQTVAEFLVRFTRET